MPKADITKPLAALKRIDQDGFGAIRSMYKVILVLLILVFSATSAGARHHRHRYHVFVPYSYPLRHNAPVIGGLDPYHPERLRSEVTPPSDSTGGVIPPEWKKQPLDAASNGGRFVSPDGSASFDFYTTAADDEPVTEHHEELCFWRWRWDHQLGRRTDLDSGLGV